MDYDVRVEDARSRPLAVVRRRAQLQELSRVVPQACGTVWNVIRAHKVSAGRHVAVYFDNEINLEVGVEVDQPFPGDGEVVASATPGGMVATTVHYGPYQRLGEAHEAVRQWCASQHHVLAGPCWEIYDHWKDEWNQDPARIRTDVFYLLQTGP